MLIYGQASLEEAGGLLPHRRVLGVDDHMEREFGDFTMEQDLMMYLYMHQSDQ